MRKTLSVLVFGVVCFGLGAVVQQYIDIRRFAPPPPVRPAAIMNEPVRIQFDNEPLWAYGFDKPPAPGEKANPQQPPNRNLRANEDPTEQTRPRKLKGSD